jgi:hypothetical protein
VKNLGDLQLCKLINRNMNSFIAHVVATKTVG